MSSYLTRNIKHSCEYNAGGIVSIFLLDIRDFISYTFREDKNFTECYVEEIRAVAKYIELDSIAETEFIETNDGSIYKQELTTFIRSLDAEKLSSLLIASSNKYLVAYITRQGHAFTFGSDGGASIAFTQQTGRLGDSSGYQVTISKQSIFPLFEVKSDELFKSPKWILEGGKWNGEGIWTREGIWKTV